MMKANYNQKTKGLTATGNDTEVKLKFPFEAQACSIRGANRIKCTVLGYLHSVNSWVVSIASKDYGNRVTHLKTEVFVENIPYIIPPDWFMIDRITGNPIFRSTPRNDKLFWTVTKLSGRPLEIQYLTGEMDLINHTDPKTEIYFQNEHVSSEFAGWILGKTGMVHFIDLLDDILLSFTEFEMIRMPIPKELRKQYQFNVLHVNILEV